MMRILILSDTHMPKKAKTLPNPLIEDLKNVELIIHAGDWQDMFVYDLLSSFSEVIGVFGNVDHEDIIKKFPEKLIVELEGCKIGVCHGHGTGKTTEKRVLTTFKEDKVDLIIYGHSHIPVKKEIGDVILFNPGSPTDKRRQARYSYGILTVENGQFKIDHVFFDKKD